MGARGKNREKSVATSQDARHCELSRIHQELQSDKQLLDRLRDAGASPETAVLFEETRRRCEQRLREICEQQQELLQAAEAKVTSLTHQNQKLREKNQRLQHKLDSALYELHKSMGIRRTTKDDAPDETAPQPQKKSRGKATTLVKRIAKYRDDLIRFVTHPGVEFHNNRAERQLRPLVISRKVSFGSNTEHGARRYCVLHSVLETCKMHGIDPIDFLRRSYLSGGLDVPDLVGTGPPAGTEDSA